MNFDIKINPAVESVNVTVTSKLNQALRMEILTCVAQQLAAEKLSRCLINLTESPLGPDDAEIESSALVQYMSAIGITPGTKMGLVYTDGEGPRRRYESAARAEGFDIRYFKKEAEAVAWLR